jgi:hypothetical protein
MQTLYANYLCKLFCERVFSENWLEIEVELKFSSKVAINQVMKYSMHALYKFVGIMLEWMCVDIKLCCVAKRISIRAIRIFS